MSVTKLVVAFLLLGGLGCASSYRQETLGVAPVGVGESTASVGVAIVDRHDQVEVSYEVITPRALRLHYKVTCPGGVRTGIIGESYEQYASRRLAEIERARQQEVQTKASLVSAVVGSVDARAQGSAGPANGTVSANVDGDAVGQAVGEGTTAQARLPAWDLGAQRLTQTIFLEGGEAGQCAMSIWPEEASQDLAGIGGKIKVVQRIDKRRVRREERAVADEAAISVRADLHASLVAAGADPQHREKLRLIAVRKEREAQARRAAELQKQREVEARRTAAVMRKQREAEALRMRVQAKLSAAEKAERREKLGVPPRKEVRVQANTEVLVVSRASLRAELALQTSAAMKTRGRLRSWCMGNGADPYYRARQRQAEFNRSQAEEQRQAELARIEVARQDKQRRDFELQLGFDLRTRTALVGTLIALGADPDYRRKRDEADLRAYEERVRDARYAKIRSGNAAPVQGDFASARHVGTLVVSSKVARPAVPAAPTVIRPTSPSANATWIAGFYEWRGEAWVWVPGVWSVPPEQDAVWVPAVEIELGGSIVFQPGAWRNSSGRRVKRSPARTNPHDHR